MGNLGVNMYNPDAMTVNGHTIQWSQYTDPTSFGSSLDAEPTDLYTALPNYSTFTCSINALTNSNWNFPEGSKYSTLTIRKITKVRPASIILYPKFTGCHIYYAFVDTNGDLVTEWFMLDSDTPNDNILINPDFSINQRGQESYSGTYAKCVDGWGLHRDPTTYAAATKSFSFPADTNGTWRGLCSNAIRNYTDYIGKSLTFSAQIKTDVDIYLRIVYGNSVSTSFFSLVPAGFSGIAFVTGTLPTSTTQLEAQITTFGYSTEGGTVKLDWAKLEVSDHPTRFVPPDPALELLRCQHYFYRIKNSSGTGAPLHLGQTFAQFPSQCNITVSLPTSMRIHPTISLSDASDILYSESSINTDVAIPATDVTRNGVLDPYDKVTLMVAGSFNSGVPYTIALKNGGYIDFSAE